MGRGPANSGDLGEKPSTCKQLTPGTSSNMPAQGVHFQSHLPVAGNLKVQEKFSAGKTSANHLDSSKFHQTHRENSPEHYDVPAPLLPIEAVGV